VATRTYGIRSVLPLANTLCSARYGAGNTGQVPDRLDAAWHGRLYEMICQVRREIFMKSLITIAPSGFLNEKTGSNLRAEVLSVLQEHPRDILIDCRDVQFMDSSGFGSLVTTLKRVREYGKQLYLCSLNSQMRIVLELTGTDRVFTIFPSSHDCIEFASKSESNG
jgi:anti-anti-sigma factor